jgi:hypothetical protein
VTLLMAAAGATDTPGATASAVRSAAAAHNVSVVYNPDTANTSVSVVDTVTGTPIGPTVTLDGTPHTPALSFDAGRAVVTAYVHDVPANTWSTQVAIMNMTTGAQIGTTLTFADTAPVYASLAPDGTRALIAVLLEPSTETGLILLDTATGTQAGTTVVLNGYPFVAPVWNPKGTRVVVTLSQLGGVATALTVLDTTTGTEAGSAVVDGFAKLAPLMTADGTRAILTTTVNNSNSWPSTRVTVVNTTSGLLAGNPLKFSGTSKVTLLGDGRTALVRTSSGFVSVLDARTATATVPLPVLPPWGLDALLRTPLGAAVGPFVFVVGLIGSAILVFYVLPAILVIPAWIGEALKGLGLPVAAETID